MAGLLNNKFGDILKGGAAAAVTGANPLLGLLLAPGMKGARERREAENELLRDKMNARNELSGLFGQTQAVQAQPTTYPAQSISDERGLLEVPEMTVPGKRGQVPSYQTPQGQQKLMGLLARLDPAAAAQAGLPNTQRSNTTEQKIMALTAEARRREYSPEETNAFIDENLQSGSGGDPLTQLLAQQQLRQRELDNEREAKEQGLADKERSRSRRTQQTSLNSTLRRVESLASNNDILSKSGWMRPGWGAKSRAGAMGGWALAKRLLGADTEEEERLMQAYTSFNKDSANLLGDMVATFGEGLDAGTDARLKQIQGMLANVEQEPGTNSKILSETIYEILDIATINGLDIEGEDRWLNMAKQFKDFSDGLVSQWDIQIGTIEDDMKYQGGHPGDPANWIPVQ